MEEPWKAPEVVSWCQLLLDSYRLWTGKELIERRGDSLEQAKTLFEAPLVVVSHGIEEDPILNYGNRLALDVWETTWDQLTAMPSRLTAEPVNQEERARMLAEAMTKGYIDNYGGVRISTRGRRFLVEHAFVWNVMDADKTQRGQAATFSHWTCVHE